MGRVRVALSIVAATLVCAGGAAYARAASAAGGWSSQFTIAASDGKLLACVEGIPNGTAPAGGWPGVILFHGLGQSYADMEPIGGAMTEFGLATLACDARGTGASEGKFGLDGPAELQDAQSLYDWFSGQSDISDTQIGAFGLSLGGGEVWNAAVAGVPFKAIVPATTWTNLGTALNPDGVPKTGLIGILSQAVPLANWDPALVQTQQDLLQGNVTAEVKSTEAARSARSHLDALTVPTLMLQGRHDFLFDMGQVTAAWKLLAGPKRLYLGDLGHPPAANPAGEQPIYIGNAVFWLDHYLADGPAWGPGLIELAHDPWDARKASRALYKKLPQTTTASVNLLGRTKLTGDQTFATRSVRLTGGPHETFGGGFVTVHYSGAASWTRLVATVLVKGNKTPVTEGAAPIESSSGTVRIPLMNEALLLPRGKKLVVKLGAASADDVYGRGVPIYAAAPPQSDHITTLHGITLGNATLKLSFLRHTVSK